MKLFEIHGILHIESKKAYSEVTSVRSSTYGYTPSGDLYKTIIAGQALFAIGKSVPCVIGDKLVGLATPYELQISSDVTVVFFELERQRLSKETAIFVGEMLADKTNHRPTMGRSYSETSGTRHTSTMDPAMAMALGLDDTASDIADDHAGRDRSGMDWDDLSEGFGYERPY